MSDDATDQTEQLRNIVGTILPDHLRDSFVAYAKLDAFRGEDGQIDTDKVMGHLTAIAVARTPQQQQRNWGQYSGNAPGEKAGAAARAALAKRHGVARDDPAPGPGDRIARGAGGRSALAKRHGGAK